MVRHHLAGADVNAWIIVGLPPEVFVIVFPLWVALRVFMAWRRNRL